MSSLWDAWQKAVDIVSADLSEFKGEVARAVGEGLDSAGAMLAARAGGDAGVSVDHDGENVDGDGVGNLLRQLMRDEATYTRPIAADEAGAFKRFCSALETRGGLAGDRLARSRMDEALGDPAAYECYEMLVPAIISMETFWKRYLYRVDKLEECSEVKNGGEGEEEGEGEGGRGREETGESVGAAMNDCDGNGAGSDGGGDASESEAGELISEPVEAAIVKPEKEGVLQNSHIAAAKAAAEETEEKPSTSVNACVANSGTASAAALEHSGERETTSPPALNVVKMKVDLPPIEGTNEEWELWE